MLMDRGADVNYAAGFHQNSALHIAAEKGYLDLLKSMVKRGGNVHQLNRDKKEPLDIAIQHDQKAVVTYLRQNTLLELSRER